MKVKLRAKEVILFTQNIASLLKSGLSLQDSLEICSDINSSARNVELCKSLSKQINDGSTLSSGFKLFKNQFSDLYISLIEIGESTGSLSEVFEKLSNYLKEKKQAHDKLIQALVYPLIVFITALFVVLIIIFFVFPKLESVFEVFTESSEEVAMKIGSIKNGIVVFCITLTTLFMFIIAIFITRKINKHFLFVTDKIVFRIPILGKYIQTNCTNDFSFAMKLLSSSYVPFSESINKAQHVVRNLYYRSCLGNVYKKVVSGGDIGSAFREEKVFPIYLVTWIALAQSTGNVENVFLQINEYYKNETANIIQGLVVSAEPFFILITGIVIFALVGQFVLPVFNLLGDL